MAAPPSDSAHARPLATGLRALVLGAGGLGCPAAAGLCAAGVRRLTLVDDDTVDETNLGRQMLYGLEDVGRPKAEAAAQALRARHPDAVVEPLRARFGRDERWRALVRSHDIVLDGTDNFRARFAANDLCVEARVPLIHGAALGWTGHLLVVLPGRSPCLRCFFEDEPSAPAPTCAEAGVVSPLVGLVGLRMAERAADVLRGLRPPEAGALRVTDALAGRERLAHADRDPSCRACGALN